MSLTSQGSAIDIIPTLVQQLELLACGVDLMRSTEIVRNEWIHKI